jgi:uncharacterized protein (DUF952 family)
VLVLHLVAADTWRAWPRDRPYVAPSLASEGFIHCTAEADTLLAVASARYRDEPGELLVLEIELDRLTSAVRWEPAAPAPPPGVSRDVLFPHVYGPIELDAVVGVRRLRRAPDGTALGYEPATTPGSSPSARRTRPG